MTDAVPDDPTVDVRFDHTIVAAADARTSAAYFTRIFGLPAPVQVGSFQQVRCSDGRIFDFSTTDGEITSQHYAFLVNEATFERVIGLLRDWDQDHWADPGRRMPGQINTSRGGRGVYFLDPSGHVLEAITERYDGTELT